MMHQTDRRQQQYCQDHIEYLSIKVTAQTIPDHEQHHSGNQQGDQRDQRFYHSLLVAVHHHADQYYCHDDL